MMVPVYVCHHITQPMRVVTFNVTPDIGVHSVHPRHRLLQQHYAVGL